MQGDDGALDDLATAMADADRGGSLYAAADLLIQLAAERAEPDKVLRVLSGVRPRTWLRLDVEFRRWSHSSDHWPQIIDAAWDGSDSVALLLVACSGDGRRRQRAVNAPLMVSDQGLLPMLLIRSADWAEPVRVDAMRALPAALHTADTDALIRAAGVATAMRDWRRGENAIAAVASALRTRPDGTLAAARRNEDVHVRRLAYRVWLEPGRADSAAVVEAALAEQDNVCQRLCVNAAIRAAGDQHRDTLERLLSARFARVRAEALAGLVQIGHPEAGESLLSDRSAAVRATAQWAMRRAGLDSAASYREMLLSVGDSALRGVLAGLGECGTIDDSELARGYLGHELPRVRAEAARAVRRLGGPLDRIADMITDPAPIVVREVMSALRGQTSLPSTDLLWSLLSEDQPPHVRRAAFSLLVGRDTWTRIAAGLGGVADSDEKLRAYARSDLTGWLDREASTTYQKPHPSTLDHLGALIDAAEPRIGASEAHALRWHLGLSS
ncbi:hypothetical protein VST63_12120 [Mycolicibacterium sp. 050232]|uniref:hypothetical protein n=1 Tax=Mycolicibacterium sp. 050232 TaxID=3113982 RepID=UPI002E2A9D83|nr:hypothetical protein [Mycolicibacterium sp. 050232]MED5813105.1 hypothetical protein [Mycolicibacterium sp. 050232]